MRGSVRGQTLHLLNTSGVKCIGESKFGAKDSARMALAAEGRSGVPQNIAEKTGMFSITTIDNYRDKWQELGKFAKTEFGIRDLEKLTGAHVKEFLAYKTELGVSYSHWSGYSAAFGKLENALNAYSDKYDRGNVYDFRTAINELRPEARDELPRFAGTRNYDSPHELIAALGNQAHYLAASIQHESGLRLAGGTIIKESQLRGFAQDSYTGKNVGLIDYIGKGGKPGTAHVSPEVYRVLATHITSQGEFKVSADGYRQSLKEAAQQSGQNYNGSHGLRWNYAQQRFSELQANGVSYEKALGVVSHELGHNRIEITRHYLGL
jgi:hypothetical protein